LRVITGLDRQISLGVNIIGFTQKAAVACGSMVLAEGAIRQLRKSDK
jgi:hypothetical protein